MYLTNQIKREKGQLPLTIQPVRVKTCSSGCVVYIMCVCEGGVHHAVCVGGVHLVCLCGWCTLCVSV